MKIESTIGRTLVFSQVSALQRAYTLKDAESETVLGTVTFRSNWAGSFATGQCGGETWTFKRKGVFKPIVTGRVMDSESEIVRFGPDWMSGGEIELGDRRFRWKSQNFFSTSWHLLDRTEAEVISCKEKFSFGLKSELTLGSAARNLADLPLLVMFCCYLRVLAYEDMAALAA
ncbi:MAG: hypothetical protein SFV18_02725 [Bryobacteraceae bacterium]|nr:hypothetical protein [Bryobacteraceae bacterium]